MKTITLLACAALIGSVFASPASAQDVRVGVGVSVGSGRDGFSVRIGVGDRHDRHDRRDRNDRWDRHDRHDRWDRRPPVIILPAPRCEPPSSLCSSPATTRSRSPSPRSSATVTSVTSVATPRAGSVSGIAVAASTSWSGRCACVRCSPGAHHGDACRHCQLVHPAPLLWLQRQPGHVRAR